MSKPTSSVLYIELDCLLDTRLAVLYSFGEALLKTAFTEAYYERVQDVFPGIDRETFNQRYVQRDKRCLKNAMATAMVQFVKEFVNETLHLAASSPHQLIPKVVVNTFPYVLTEEETTTLVKAFVVLTDSLCDVQLIHEPISALTPSFVKRHYSIMVMYEYYQWIEYHCANDGFKRVTCPEVSLIGPILYFKELPSAAELRLAKEINTTPFRAFELQAGPFIQLALLPIENFSIALKLQRTKQPTPS